MIGIDAPELKADGHLGQDSKDYLESLLEDHQIIVLFEKSDKTLDGRARGNFGRPLAYVFTSRNGKDLHKFVNLEMLYKEKAVESKYSLEYQYLLDIPEQEFSIDNFQLNLSVDALDKNLVTWGELKSMR